MFIHSEVKVSNFATFAKEWLVNEVPPLLIGSTLVLDFIGECCTLREWMITLALGPLWIGLFKCLKDIQRLLKCFWVFFLKN